MFINLKFKWRQSLPQNEPKPAQGLSWTNPSSACVHGLIAAPTNAQLEFHQSVSGFWNFILLFYLYIFFYYTVPSVPSHWLEMGCTNNKTKTCLKEGVAERLKLLLIHYLRNHHVLVSAPFKQVFKHSLGGKATKSVRGSFFHQLLGSVELHAPREAWLWRV